MSLSGDAGCAPRLVCHASLPCHGSAAGTASPTSSRGPGRGTGRGLSLMRRPGDSGRPCRRLLLIVASSIRASTVRSSFRGPGVHHHAPRPRARLLPPPDLDPGCSRRERRAACGSVSRRGFLAARPSAGAAVGRVPGFRRVRLACPVQPVPHSGRPGGASGEGPGAPACGKVQALGRAGSLSWCLESSPRGVLGGWCMAARGWGALAGGEERQCSDPRDLPWASPTPGRGGSEGDLGTRRWHLLVLTPGRPSP